MKRPPIPTIPSRASRLRRLAQRLRARRALRSRRALAVFAIVCAALGVAAEPFVHAHMQAIAVLNMVSGQPVPHLLRTVASEPLTTTDLLIPAAPGAPALRARLYAPTRQPNAPAMIVLHGVHHLGMDEPRLVAFARAMAACGLRVLTPELPGIKDYHVAADSTASIGSAATWMAVQNPGRARRPVAIMGLSFSGGLSLLAAADPAFQPAIKFVVAIGAQGAMSRVASFYRTGEDALPSGAPFHLTPHEYGALVLEYDDLEDFVPAVDIPALRTILRAHLYEDPAAEKLALAALTPAQHTEAKQLLDTTSAATRALLQAAEQKHIADMQTVSPSGRIGTLTTPVYLLHGTADNIIPSAESLWMASELPNESLRAVLISPVLSHLDLDGAQPTARDRWRLVHFFALILHDAEM